MKLPSTYRPKMVEDEYEGDLNVSAEHKSYRNDKNIKFRIKQICDRVCIKMDANAMNVFVCLMKGGAIFFSYFIHQMEEINCSNLNTMIYYLISAFRKQIAIDYLRIKTYNGQNKQSDPKIMVNEDDFIDVKGKNVFIVDEIIDSGSSMTRAVEWLKTKKPKAITTITLLMKRNPKNDLIFPDFCAFEIPNLWVVGFGCDMNGHYRNLKDIYVLSDAGKELEKL